MTSQPNSNIALNGPSASAMLAGDATPGLASLAPPTGAYFGRATQMFSSQAWSPQIPPNLIFGAGNAQQMFLQSYNELLVYWINPTTSTAGSYLIIHKRSLFANVGTLVLRSDNRYRGWMLCSVEAPSELVVKTPSSSCSIALLATSPNTGDQYSSVSQGMTIPVVVQAGGLQPRYIEVSDQAPLSLQGWAVTSIGQGYPWWIFRQATPWDYLATAPSQVGDAFYPAGSNGLIAIPDISQSSLAATTYATWMISNPGWTQPAPAACTVELGAGFSVKVYVTWTPSGSSDGNGGLKLQNGPTQPGTVTLSLDAITKQIVAAS